MKVQVDIYIAASLEGFIADAGGGTDWVLDDALFEKTARKYGCICMGKTTFKEYKKPPFKGVETIVLTHRVPKKATKGVHFVSSPQAAMASAQKLGFKKMLVIGGGQTNQSFMQAGVVKRVFVDIHPILLGQGQQMFGDFNAKFDFTMVRQSWNGAGFTHAEYSVGKTHTSSVAVIVRDNEGSYLTRQVKDGICLGDTSDLAATDYPEHTARQLIKQFTKTDYRFTECGTFDTTRCTRQAACSFHL